MFGCLQANAEDLVKKEKAMFQLKENQIKVSGVLTPLTYVLGPNDGAPMTRPAGHLQAAVA